MEIVGNGFLARHFGAHFGDRHPGTTVIAAGVSTTVATDLAAFDREADLVHDVVRRCSAEGRTVVLLSTSSAAMYGTDGEPGTEDGPVFPRNPYGRHKLALERVCTLSGTPWLALRLTHIAGPGQQPDQLLPALTRQVLAGEVTVHRGAYRDLLEVGHLPPVLDALLDRNVTDEVVNVASGNPLAIEDIVDGIEQRLRTRAERTFVSRPAARTLVSTEKLRRLVPAFAELDFGPGYLDTLLDHYFEAGELTAARTS
jgi:nucleoside-diphosphate-sugar epimerase